MTKVTLLIEIVSCLALIALISSGRRGKSSTLIIATVLLLALSAFVLTAASSFARSYRQINSRRNFHPPTKEIFQYGDRSIRM